MQVEYTGRQVAITPALKQIAEEGLARIGKVTGENCSAHLVLTAEKYRQTADVTVKCKHHSLVGLSESPNMETALRDALAKAETQAIRHKDKKIEKYRQPKEDKAPVVAQLARPRSNAVAPKVEEAPPLMPPVKTANGTAKKNGAVPVVVHSPAEKAHIAEPHVVHSAGSVATRPMTLEEAVKEAEFRDRDVFVFRTGAGAVNVLHRKRDGTMELIEASAV
ncbi:MAG: ribosome hibernation-promoting factor, HPF/YfiA family [Acidobacteriaceae bacterium]